MIENIIRAKMPAIHPNWAIAHARESTPDPITAVIICALAVIKVPSKTKNQNNERKKKKRHPECKTTKRKIIANKCHTRSFNPTIIIKSNLVIGFDCFYRKISTTPLMKLHIHVLILCVCMYIYISIFDWKKSEKYDCVFRLKER